MDLLKSDHIDPPLKENTEPCASNNNQVSLLLATVVDISYQVQAPKPNSAHRLRKNLPSLWCWTQGCSNCPASKQLQAVLKRLDALEKGCKQSTWIEVMRQRQHREVCAEQSLQVLQSKLKYLFQGYTFTDPALLLYCFRILPGYTAWRQQSNTFSLAEVQLRTSQLSTEMTLQQTLKLWQAPT